MPRITELSVVSTLTDNDLLTAVDVEDPQMSAQGTNVAITKANLLTNADLTNPSVTGDIAVGGHVLVASDEDAISASTGAIRSAGGISAVKNGWFGDLVSMTRLVLRQAASVIIPGGTSFAIRNNADSANNLLVEDDGDVTVRKDLAVTNDVTVSGDANVTGSVGATTVSAGIVEGTTHLLSPVLYVRDVKFTSSAPSSPADGDFWFDGADLKLRSGGVTYTITMS